MNIFISNLSFNTGDTELKELFTAYGTVVSAKVITDRETGWSRGFGFVEMSTTEEGNEAITGLQGKEIEGREITVSQARNTSPKRDSGTAGSYRKKEFSKW